MTSLRSTGHLSNAPVRYVLCKIDCGDLLAFESMLPESQNEFRKNGFPIFHDQQTRDMHIHADRGLKVEERLNHTYHFISGDYQDGIAVSGGSVFVQTRNYKTFNDFAALVGVAHKIYSRVTGMNLIRAIGLRYIDLVLPTQNNQLEYYLQPFMLCPELSVDGKISPLEARMQHTYKTPLESYLFLRSFAGKGHKIVPDDLLPMIDPLFTKAGKRDELLKDLGTSVLIDTDHFKQFQPIQNSADIDLIGTLDDMHKYTSHLFKSVVTPEALKEWK